MMSRVHRIAKSFATAPSKAAWLDDRASWKLFRVRQVIEDRINQKFDAKHGTDTAGEIPLVAVGVGSADAARGNLVYRPLWQGQFRSTLMRLESTLGDGLRSFSFVDVGSGKGKLLLLASFYPFKSIVGVEYAEGLHRIAERNVRRFADPAQQCRQVTPTLGDALTFALPPGPVIAMIFNAFDIETTAKVLGNLIHRREQQDAPTFVIYENVRRVAEIGDAFTVTAPWKTLERTRHHIIVGDKAACEAWSVPPGMRPSDVLLSAAASTQPGTEART